MSCIINSTVMRKKSRISIFIYYLLTLLFCSAEVLQLEHIHSLRKRSIIQSVSESFHVSNVTFACNQTQNDATMLEIQQRLQLSQSISIKRLDKLTDEDMQHLLQFKGGTFIPEYLATDSASARMNFPNARLMRFRRNYDRVAAEIKNTNSMMAKLKPGGQPNQGNNRGGTNIIPGQSGMSVSLQWQTYSKKLLENRGKSPNRQPQGAFMRGFSKRRRRRQLGMSLFPTTTQLPRNINENCSEAGDPSPNDPNYLHLCKVCSSQRVLEDNFYPHLLNEVYCEQSENGCLGSGNGKCAKTMFHVHILKRREDICRLCIKDQEPLIMNEWEIHNEAISVGCECMLNKNSDYRNSWFNSNPTTSYNERFVGKR